MSNWQKVLFASDLHGDQQYPAAVNALLEFSERWKPDVKIFGGDLWDFRPLRGKASEEERRDSIVRDFNDGMQFFQQWRPNYFLRGNHDERLWEKADEDNGIISDLCRKFSGDVESDLSKLKCAMRPYHKTRGLLQIGKVKFLHGFYAGVNAARRHALSYGSCVFGHVHSIDHQTIEHFEFTMARSAGCLCKLDMPYLDRSVGSLRHQHGFIALAIHRKTGLFHCQQMVNVAGSWTFEALAL